MPVAEKIIMGIDPGTNIMGYGVLRVVGKKVKYETMGECDMHGIHDHYLRLGHVFKTVTGLIAQYLPDEIAIEATFYGKNVQSMLKLGRAQGIAIAAAINRDVPIHEYAPLKIKMAVTGNGQASKEQVAGMLQRILKFNKSEMSKHMDATDALAVAYCHYMQSTIPTVDNKHFKSWKDFAEKNKSRISTTQNKTKD